VFQLLKNPQFDFMGKRNIFLAVSAIAVLSAVAVLAINGINRGIEFTGGTELQIKYATSPDIGQIRSDLKDAGLPNVHVTRIGTPEENEVYVRIGLTSGTEEEQEDLAQAVAEALRPEGVHLQRESGLIDLNVGETGRIQAKLEAAPGLTSDQAAALAGAITQQRRSVAIFNSLDDVAGLPGMTTEALEYLKKWTFTGPFAIRSQSYIGPAIGRELMQKAFFAILGSLIGMLIYIWIRFQFQWGLAAVIALTHDAFITLGLFSLFSKEMSLPVVAAFLTLIGYSVNDSVVVFDRIRENIRLRGSTMSLPELVNKSINQTLSRTIITSGSTWIVVLGIFLFGGEALNPFAFVLVIGILVGTYSSIYIAAPVLVLWKQISDRRSGRRPSAKKVKAQPSA
jgi:preprotein translocase subunit SecF